MRHPHLNAAYIRASLAHQAWHALPGLFRSWFRLAIVAGLFFMPDILVNLRQAFTYLLVMLVHEVRVGHQCQMRVDERH